MFCAGYTSGSDLQGEAAVEAREDCRSSVPPAENCERPTTAAEWTKTLPSKPVFGSGSYYIDKLNASQRNGSSISDIKTWLADNSSLRSSEW